jgi:hypothetical protein
VPTPREQETKLCNNLLIIAQFCFVKQSYKRFFSDIFVTIQKTFRTELLEIDFRRHIHTVFHYRYRLIQK